MKKYLTISLFFACFAFVVPGISHAYKTTGQNVIELPMGGAIYMISYDFGSEIYGFYLPIIPKRKSTLADQGRTQTFVLQDEDKDASEYGSVAGIVLSNAEIREGKYFVPRGEARRFTMLVIATPEKDPSSRELALQMTNLPFTMIDKDGKEINGKLNTSELQYYMTKTVDLEPNQYLSSSRL